MIALVALLCGMLFGLGLSVSGMTNPAKVQAFLDVFGSFDPSLAFVMGGAVAVSGLGYVVVRRRAHPWLAAGFGIPTRQDVDLQLATGAGLFGIGWGLVGLCPGPALAGLWRGSLELLVFDAAMLAGMFLVRPLLRG